MISIVPNSTREINFGNNCFSSFVIVQTQRFGFLNFQGPSTTDTRVNENVAGPSGTQNKTNNSTTGAASRGRHFHFDIFVALFLLVDSPSSSSLPSFDCNSLLSLQRKTALVSVLFTTLTWMNLNSFH